MTSLADHHSSQLIKLLNIGESKTGKTGALASLAKAGYRLWILDYDNGVDILANVLRDDPAAMARVTLETPRDTIVFSNGVPKLKPPIHAYKDAGKVIEGWANSLPEYELPQEYIDANGEVQTRMIKHRFTPNDILILDTLTTFSDAAFNEALMLGGRLNQRPQLQDYGWMADSVKLFIEMLTSPAINCHVIVNTHIRYFSGDAEDQTTARGLPNAKGQEISRVVSRYFNTVVLTRSSGSGAGTKRLISTQPQGVVEVATSAPLSVKASYSVTDGLAPLFADILGHGPQTPKEPESK